jgi:hypothetical protein
MPNFKYTSYTVIFYVADHSIYPDPDFKSQSNIIISGLTAFILTGDWLSNFFNAGILGLNEHKQILIALSKNSSRTKASNTKENYRFAAFLQ